MAWSDKRVSTVAALQETGRGLTLEMVEACCGLQRVIEKQDDIKQGCLSEH